ncbi:Hypothetical predicted protein [Mytilus galloprovincialis]|uniref:Uncharacterized protein n=1 Tax=Mytilus galloprovincialis TaxID=29158 RepID=A0A8B6BKN4_MYTGA|nr:Hypothetical predicted protein [Mytilus galloprovincialis]
MLSRDHFIDALDDADTRLCIHQAHPKTLNDAVKLAVELEAFYIADKQRDKPLSVRNFAISENSEVSGQIKTLTDVVEELRRELQFLKSDMSQQRRGFNNNNNKPGKEDVGLVERQAILEEIVLNMTKVTQIINKKTE